MLFGIDVSHVNQEKKHLISYKIKHFPKPKSFDKNAQKPNPLSPVIYK